MHSLTELAVSSQGYGHVSLAEGVSAVTNL